MTHSTPHLRVDSRILQQNIDAMAAHARAAGVALRPHAKTHKTLEVARLQVEAGAAGLSVATVGEAEVFAAGGFRDLFIAYPLWVDDAKARRLRALVEGAEDDGGARPVRLAVGVDSVEGALRLGRALGGAAGRVAVRVEVDSGHHRSGTDASSAGDVALAAAGAGLAVEGVFTFPGHGYGPGNAGAAADDEARALSAARDSVLAEGLECGVVSGGSTPTAMLSTGSVVTELRPGVYVFNDAQQLEGGTCGEDRVALSAVSTVVSSSGRHAVADAGSKVLGADRPGWTTGFGRVAGAPGARITALSEHHATLEYPEGDAVPRPGDTVRLYPNHVCTAVNLVDELVVEGQGFGGTWLVRARGRNS